MKGFDKLDSRVYGVATRFFYVIRGSLGAVGLGLQGVHPNPPTNPPLTVPLGYIGFSTFTKPQARVH